MMDRKDRNKYLYRGTKLVNGVKVKIYEMVKPDDLISIHTPLNQYERKLATKIRKEVKEAELGGTFKESI